MGADHKDAGMQAVFGFGMSNAVEFRRVSGLMMRLSYAAGPYG